jgi:hypothetical protein
MRRLFVLALFLAAPSALAGPMTSATAMNTAASNAVASHGNHVARPVHQLYRFTHLKYGLLKWCKTGPREAEQGDLTF